MQSITSNPSLAAADGAQPETVPRPESHPGDPVELGLQVLIEMISLVEQPVDLDEERQALLALRAIHAESALSVRGTALREELDRCVQLVNQPEAQNLIDWIDVPARGLDRLRPIAHTRHRRLMLLFILLAKTVGRVHEYPIPGLLRDMTPHAWAHRLDCDLNWLPRWLGGRRYFDVAKLYLEVTLQILFENLLIDSAGLTTDEFESWPWMRQILHLQGWRKSWNLHQAHSPALCAHRLEFSLARRGVFRRLARTGGLLARRTLARLGYRDLPRRDTSWPRLRFAVLAILIGLSCGGWWVVQRQADAVMAENDDILTKVRISLTRENDHE